MIYEGENITLADQWETAVEGYDDPAWFADLVYNPVKFRFDPNADWLWDAAVEGARLYNLTGEGGKPIIKTDWQSPEGVQSAYPHFFRPFDPRDWSAIDQTASFQQAQLEQGLDFFSEQQRAGVDLVRSGAELERVHALEDAELLYKQDMGQIALDEQTIRLDALRSLRSMDDAIARSGLTSGVQDKKKSIQLGNITSALNAANYNKVLANRQLDERIENAETKYDRIIEGAETSVESDIALKEAEVATRRSDIREGALLDKLGIYSDWQASQIGNMADLLKSEAYIGYQSFNEACRDPNATNFSPQSMDGDEPRVACDQCCRYEGFDWDTEDWWRESDEFESCMRHGFSESSCRDSVYSSIVDYAAAPGMSDYYVSGGQLHYGGMDATPGGVGQSEFVGIYGLLKSWWNSIW